MTAEPRRAHSVPAAARPRVRAGHTYISDPLSGEWDLHLKRRPRAPGAREGAAGEAGVEAALHWKEGRGGCQWGRARCTERMAEEAHIKACVFAAVLLRDSGKPLEVGEILKIVKAAGTDGVSEATATTVITVLQAEQACLQLRAATDAQQQ